MNRYSYQNEPVSIIGGGVAGLCVAQALLIRGIKATVFDRQAEPGPQSCSWWAGGMLAPYCEMESAEEPVLRLGKLAADWWQKHTGKVNRRGSLVIASGRDYADLQRFAQQTENFTSVGSDEISGLEPDLSGRFTRGLYYQDEAHLAPREALNELKVRLKQQGVTFVTQALDPHHYAHQHQTLSQEPRLVIDCRGINAKPSIQDLRGVKGEMLILHCPDVELNRPIRILHPRIPLYIVPRGDGVYMLGATMVESSAKKHATARSILELLSAAYALNPGFGEAEVLEIGVDSRPAFNDNLPRIRRKGNIIQANGLYRHGFLLAPALASMVAEHVCTGAEPEWFEHS